MQLSHRDTAIMYTASDLADIQMAVSESSSIIGEILLWPHYIDVVQSVKL